MPIYLVGGAVRDSLLGYPSKEKDWVVVGQTPKSLLDKGFVQVGKDFPVFLHPETKEEYALARKERKRAPGYHGFDCDDNPAVTLEEDLGRRDLTINAIAMDDQGRLIDPYHGQADLQAKILRHVSPAFVEDPVRVLRLGRFLARYQHLGFRVADETKTLVYRMVQAGELAHLVPDRLWQEWARALGEQQPEAFFYLLRETGALAVLFPEIDALFGVPNPPQYHPEIDSGIHSLMALAAAARRTADVAVRFAAVLHDLGKALTPMVDWPKHKGHELTGLGTINALCERLPVPKSYQHLALLGCEHHLTVHRLTEMNPTTVVRFLEKVDAFRRPQVFEQLLLVAAADAEGSGHKEYKQLPLWQALRNHCAAISVQDFIEKGCVGSEIKAKLHEARVTAVKQFLG